MTGGETSFGVLSNGLRVPSTFIEYDDRQEIRDHCGIAVATSEVGAPLTEPMVRTLSNMQHRGHQSAGVLMVGDDIDTIVKNPGYVREALPHSSWEGYEKENLTVAMGHVRYSTTSGQGFLAAQPSLDVDRDTGLRVSLAHNGNYINTEEIGEEFGIDPSLHQSDSTRLGSILLASMVDINRRYGEKVAGLELPIALEEIMPRLVGAGSLVLYDGARVYGFRDPKGFRPLALGRRADGWAIASESSVLPNLGAVFNREVQPGELLTLKGNQIRSKNLYKDHPEMINPALCLMEFIYLARPDTVIGGMEVEAFREETGRRLAQEHPVDVDAIVGVPETGMSVAMGYSEVSGIPLRRGIVKNSNAGRTFIARTQEERRALVREKFQLIRSNIEGLRLGVPEDSIVRGTTSSELGLMLKEAGALEVHWLVGSPPVTDPCFMGIDTGTHSQLIAARMGHAEIEEYLNGESVRYLSLAQTLASAAKTITGFCAACFTGEYPIDIPVDLRNNKQ